MSRRMRRRRMNRRRRRERVGLDFPRGSGPAVVRPRGSDVHRRRLRRRGRTRTPRGERRRRVGGRGGSGGYRVGRTTFGAAVVARMPRVAVRFVAAAVVDEGRHPLQVRAPARASPRAALRRGHVGLAKSILVHPLRCGWARARGDRGSERAVIGGGMGYRDACARGSVGDSALRSPVTRARVCGYTRRVDKRTLCSRADGGAFVPVGY